MTPATAPKRMHVAEDYASAKTLCGLDTNAVPAYVLGTPSAQAQNVCPTCRAAAKARVGGK